MIKPIISKLTERNGGRRSGHNARVCQATPITTTVSACVVKDVRVGVGFVMIAVFTKGVTSTISAAKKGFTVPIVSRHFFIPSIVMDLAVIPNAWAEIFGANKR